MFGETRDLSACSPWLGVELRHLAALAAVAREGSFRGAAQSLGYVQSAVSQQVAHLERLIGGRLVERQRGTRAIALTDAGELLRGHADEILAHFRAAEADLEALSDGGSSRLRVGVYESVAVAVMPRILTRLRRHFESVRLETVEAGAEELPTLVENGELELAFADLPVRAGPFEVEELLQDPYVLLVPGSSSLADQAEPPTAEQVCRLPLIDHRLMARIAPQLSAAGWRPRYVYRSGIFAAIKALVAQGVGAAILPRLTIEGVDERITVLELGDLLAPRAVGLVRHRDRIVDPTRQGFWTIAREVCAELSPSPR